MLFRSPAASPPLAGSSAEAPIDLTIGEPLAAPPPPAEEQVVYDPVQLEAVGRFPFYAVRVGRRTGIFDLWRNCYLATHAFSGSRFRGFYTWEDAMAYMQRPAPQNGGGCKPGKYSKKGPRPAKG